MAPGAEGNYGVCVMWTWRGMGLGCKGRYVGTGVGGGGAREFQWRWKRKNLIGGFIAGGRRCMCVPPDRPSSAVAGNVVRCMKCRRRCA